MTSSTKGQADIFYDIKVRWNGLTLNAMAWHLTRPEQTMALMKTERILHEGQTNGCLLFPISPFILTQF